MSSGKSVQFMKVESDESFVFVKEPHNDKDDKQQTNTFEFVASPPQDDDSSVVCAPLYKPMTSDELTSFCDVDGRVVHESKLREALFHGGCHDDVRQRVWSFIFELYPMNSTTRERRDLNIENHYKYHALKLRWQTYMKDDNSNVNEKYSGCPDDFMSADLPVYSEEHQDILSHSHDTQKSLAKTFACRQQFDETPLAWFQVVDKDIPRTDLDHPYFQQNPEEHMQKMRNILNTFGFFHSSIGYVQGMNDILTRFIIVMDSEVDAYWCFSNYMERIEYDFDQNGMVDKMILVQKLLKDLEPNLYSHLDQCGVGDLMFCHRWLLVSFKREFSYCDSICYFEMAHSRHLELDSMIALTAQDDQYRTEVMKDQGKMRSSSPKIGESKYTFEVFVCVAIIMLKRQQFLACTDESDVFSIACNIRGTLHLQDVHAKAYHLFFKYCKKSVTDEYCKKNETKAWVYLSRLFKKR